MNETTSSRLNVICFGMGAIGTYIGGSLAAHGAKVIFIEKQGFASGISRRDIHLQIGNETIQVRDVMVTSDVRQALAQQPADIALLAVKSFDTSGFLESIAGFEKDIPPILCLQNGVENEELLVKRIGEEKVIAGSITTAVGKSALGDIKLERLRGVGIETGHPLSQTLIDWFNRAGLNARGYSSRADMKWSKMLTNLLANATSAILNWTPAMVFSHPLIWQIEMEQIREALAVMKAMSIHLVDLPDTPVIAMMTVFNLLPPAISQKIIGPPLAKGRGGKMPSFHIDLYSGKNISEVTYLNGAVARFGEGINVAALVNQRLCRLLEDIAAGRVAKQVYADQPEKLFRFVKENK